MIFISHNQRVTINNMKGEETTVKKLKVGNKIVIKKSWFSDNPTVLKKGKNIAKVTDIIKIYSNGDFHRILIKFVITGGIKLQKNLKASSRVTVYN